MASGSCPEPENGAARTGIEAVDEVRGAVIPFLPGNVQWRRKPVWKQQAWPRAQGLQYCLRVGMWCLCVRMTTDSDGRFIPLELAPQIPKVRAALLRW